MSYLPDRKPKAGTAGEMRYNMNFQLNEKVKIADADNIGTVADKMRSEKTGKTITRSYLKMAQTDILRRTN